MVRERSVNLIGDIRKSRLLLISAFFLACPSLAQELDAIIHKAGVCIDESHFDQALLLYEGILTSRDLLDENKVSRILNNMGFSHFKLGHFDLAIGFYQKALRLDPEYATCLNNLAAVLMNQKKYEDALPFLIRAKTAQKDIKNTFNLFVTHYYLNNRRETLANLKEAFLLDEAYTEKRLKDKNISANEIDRLKKYLKN